jgi:hypothetical protein
LQTRDKSPHFAAPAPSEFVAQRRAFFSPAPHPSAAPLRGAALSESEVSFCGELLHFARTHFSKN